MILTAVTNGNGSSLSKNRQTFGRNLWIQLDQPVLSKGHQGAQAHILKRKWLHLPGQLLCHLHSRMVFSVVQMEPSVLQFVPLAFWPDTGRHRKEPGSILFAPSLQGEGKIPPKPPLPHGKQQQLSHSFLIGDALQPLQHRALRPFAGLPQICPSLSCTGGLRIGARSLDTASPVLSGEKDHLHPHAGSTFPNAPKNTIGLLCSKKTFLALVWLSAHQDPHVLSCQAASQLGAPSTSWCLGCSSRGAGLCTYWTTRVLFSSLLSSLWMAAWPSGIPAASRVSCHAPYVHTRVCWAIHPQLKSKPLRHSW